MYCPDSVSCQSGLISLLSGICFPWSFSLPSFGEINREIRVNHFPLFLFVCRKHDILIGNLHVFDSHLLSFLFLFFSP